MNTYWLLGRDSRVPLSKTNTKTFNWTAPVPSTGSAAAGAASATAGAAATKQLVSQMTKQVSVASDDVNKTSTAAGIVKGI
jgi:hypothetical protein